MHPRLRIMSAVVALGAALLIAMPVSATSQWTTSSQAGISAFASNQTCTDNPDGTVTCQGQSITVFEGSTKASGEPTRKGEQACYSEFAETFDPTTGEGQAHGLFGCALDARTLVSDGLTSITLAPTVIELSAFECNATGCTESPAGSATVDGEWTGVGPILSQKGKFKFDDGACVQVNADKGRFRQASFQGSIDATEASIADGSFTFRTNCSF